MANDFQELLLIVKNIFVVVGWLLVAAVFALAAVAYYLRQIHRLLKTTIDGRLALRQAQAMLFTRQSSGAAQSSRFAPAASDDALNAGVGAGDFAGIQRESITEILNDVYEDEDVKHADVAARRQFALLVAQAANEAGLNIMTAVPQKFRRDLSEATSEMKRKGAKRHEHSNKRRTA